jgi:hypothetical protein
MADHGVVCSMFRSGNVWDSLMLKFMLEQVFGKAPQPRTGPEGGPIEIKGVEITVRRK